MEKIGQIGEITIKIVYMFFSLLLAIFIFKSIIDIFPLYKAFGYTEVQLYNAIGKTKFGLILLDLGDVDVIDYFLIKQVLVSFIAHIDVVAVLFLLLTILMLGLYFIFIKWGLVKTYLKMSGYLILLYIGKHILFALSLLVFFKNDLYTLSIGIVIGTTFYLLCCVGQLIIVGLWIIKFIFNIAQDIDILNKLSY